MLHAIEDVERAGRTPSSPPPRRRLLPEDARRHKADAAAMATDVDVPAYVRTHLARRVYALVAMQVACTAAVAAPLVAVPSARASLRIEPHVETPSHAAPSLPGNAVCISRSEARGGKSGEAGVPLLGMCAAPPQSVSGAEARGEVSVEASVPLLGVCIASPQSVLRACFEHAALSPLPKVSPCGDVAAAVTERTCTAHVEPRAEPAAVPPSNMRARAPSLSVSGACMCSSHRPHAR